MRFQIILVPISENKSLAINYQYPLSAAIYKIIERADTDYATFLHEKGYSYRGKSFKLFSFSDLRTPFRIKGDRLLIMGDKVEFSISFHVPDAADNFIKGLFMHQQIELADDKSKVVFQVQQVQSETSWKGVVLDGQENGEVMLEVMSPVVVGRRNERGIHDYLSPIDDGYADLLIYNLLEKHSSVNSISDIEKEELTAKISLKVHLHNRPPRARLITIKANTAAQTRVRGFDKFRIQLKAPIGIIQLALNSGIGLNNAQGMGCIGIVQG